MQQRCGRYRPKLFEREERMDLGRVGIWSGRMGSLPSAGVCEAVRQVEGLGYRSVWYPESAAKEAFSLAGVLLAAAEEITVASGIANIWARDPMAMMNGARTLSEAYPGRFLLGIGVSHAPSVEHRGGTYARPLTAMREYLDAMDTATYRGPQPPEEPPVVLAALGPRMLELAGARTLGAHPYFVPVEHTARARATLGDGPLLATEQAVVLSEDPAEARDIARGYTRYYLRLDNYRNNLLRLGWSEDDVAGDGSDALVDALVGWGDTVAIQTRVAAHLEAGADHVCVQVLNGPVDRFPVEDLTAITPALLEL
jgi:probable F420-dependent oxidoreductase